MNCRLPLEQLEHHFVLIDANPWQNASYLTAQQVCAAEKDNRHGRCIIFHFLRGSYKKREEYVPVEKL